MLGHILCLLYTSDIPVCDKSIIATFTDVTAVLSEGYSIENSTGGLPDRISDLNNRVQILYVTYTNCKVNFLPVIISQQVIMRDNNAKYLG